LTASPALLAQPSQRAYVEPRFEYQPAVVSFTPSVAFLSWELRSGGETQKIQQAYLPATLSFAVARHTNLTLAAAGGFSREEMAFAREFNGLSDMRLRLSHSFGNSQWFAGAGVTLPTGKSKLDAEENAVTNALNENVLGFPLQRYGAGLDFELSLARAFNFNDQLGCGLGGTLVFPGEFEFREETQTRYHPGNRYVVTMTLNRIDPVLAWRVSLLGQYFDFDKLAGQKFFKQGWQFEPAASLEWTFAPAWRTQLALTHIWKDGNEFSPVDAANLPPEHFYIQSSTYARLTFQRSFSDRAQAGAYLHFNHFGESNVQQLNRARVGRVGALITAKLSEHAMIGASADYGAGSAQNPQAGNIDLSGYGLGLWLKTQL
jgi:hypothetical protein